MPFPRLFLGLDVGDARTRVLVDDGELCTQHLGDGMHLLRDGATRTADRLAEHICDALARDALGGGTPTIGTPTIGGICLGVAGASRFEDRQLLLADLRERLADSGVAALRDAPLAVEHAATIALEAAFAGESGAIVTVGAGSVAYGRTVDGDLLRVGGWGALLGDEGGGYAIGLAALRSVAASMDGGPPSLIAVLLAERHGLLTQHDLTAFAYRPHPPIAGLAPLVVEAAAKEDWVATSILKQQANALAKQIGWLASRAGDAIEKRLSFVGEMSAPGYYRECIAEALLRHLPHWRIARPQAEPVEGALRLARRLDPDAESAAVESAS
ncbi:MAG: BadF/BadG/BcrA/BcrD ATPase family protein [Bacteroidota bacterium]